MSPKPNLLDILGCEPKDISPDFNDSVSLPRVMLKLSYLELRVHVLELQREEAATRSWWNMIRGKR